MWLKRRREPMREALFRGKRIDNGEWIEGALLEWMGRVFIVGEVLDYDTEYIAPEWWRVVDPDTIGQFTGLLDKNGRRVFEGDVVKDMAGDTFTVFYNSAHCAFLCEYQTNSFKRQGFWKMDNQCSLGIEVISTIHDQPEKEGAT